MAEIVNARGSASVTDLVESLEVSEATVRRDGLFVQDDGMPAWVGVELMAQGIATWAGLRRKEEGAAVRLGFLLGTRRFESSVSRFPIGALLSITARCEMVAENSLAIFVCSIDLEGTTVATAHLNVFQPVNIEAYLKDTEP